MAEHTERQGARKIRIKEIEEGKYVTEEGWNPNYLLSPAGEKIFRVNIIAAIVSKEERGSLLNFLADDGSGRIWVRSFEEKEAWKEINVGESALIIGKVRIYNNEKYISPEIIKKIAREWAKMRSLELAEPAKRVVAEEEERAQEDLPEENSIIELIRSLDKGEGAAIEEIKSRSRIKETEQLIDKMLMEGEIFQNLPGRVKVL